jgi:ABC-type lipoprotein export system ATPase subunit
MHIGAQLSGPSSLKDLLYSERSTRDNYTVNNATGVRAKKWTIFRARERGNISQEFKLTPSTGLNLHGGFDRPYRG